MGGAIVESMDIEHLTTEELEAELRRRQFQEDLQYRIYCGEVEATDADGIETMANFK